MKHRASAATGRLPVGGLREAPSIFAAIGLTAAAEPERSAFVAAGLKVSAGKKTALGLYLGAAEAYVTWKAAPDKVTIIDVRTPEEYAFVGHAEMALNIPLVFLTYERKNGWKNTAPCTDSIDAEKILLEQGASKDTAPERQ